MFVDKKNVYLKKKSQFGITGTYMLTEEVGSISG